MIKIAIFASGSGSNAENIADYFKNRNDVEIAIVVTNNPNAYVLERAKRLGIESVVFSKNEMDCAIVANFLKNIGVEWIVLAGYLLKIPQNLIDAFENRIVNIHPALLPKFGGKGMYGDRVHKAVVNANETESGITIHYVNENYDEGAIIYQAKCDVLPADTADVVAAKVHALEYEWFPVILDRLFTQG